MLAGPTSRSHNTPVQAPGFRLFPFRSPLLRESRLLSLPPGTEMFHFPGYRLATLCIQIAMSRHYSERVSPFGNPRIKACLRLPEAYRSLPRPSSPADAKASTVCPSQLDQNGQGENAYPKTLCSCQRTIHSSRQGRQSEPWMMPSSPRSASLPAKYPAGAPPTRPLRPGGRAWARTRDLVLIRDAL